MVRERGIDRTFALVRERGIRPSTNLDTPRCSDSPNSHTGGQLVELRQAADRGVRVETRMLQGDLGKLSEVPPSPKKMCLVPEIGVDCAKKVSELSLSSKDFPLHKHENCFSRLHKNFSIHYSRYFLKLFWVSISQEEKEREYGNFDSLSLIWFLCVPQRYTLGTSQKQQTTPQTTERRNRRATVIVAVPPVRGVAMVTTPLTTLLL